MLNWLFGKGVNRRATPDPIQLAPGISAQIEFVGSDEYWATVKEAKRLRREKRFSEAIALFERAIAMGHTEQVRPEPMEVEIARTWWHDGRPDDAITRCNTLLPDHCAIELLVAIWREQAKESLKRGDRSNARKCFQCMVDLEKLKGFRMLTTKDRQTMKSLKGED